MREAKSNAGYTAFFFALRSGDVRRVQNYLASNKRLALQSKDGFPALNFCLRECFQSVEIIHDIAAQLLDHGADVNSKDTNGNTPLLETLTSPVLRTSKNLLALVQLLLDRGANVNSRYRSGNCVLQAVFARRDTEGLVELVRLLLERGADASFQFPDQRNFLHHALLARGSSLTREDTFSLIKLLLEHEAEVNQKDKDGNTPLHLATLCCDPQIVTLLLHYQAHVNVKNFSHGNTPLHNALLCSEDDFIAGGGFLNMAHLLMDAGADLCMANTRGCTPLHDALTQQNKFLWEDILKLVRFLLKRGGGNALNIKDKDGNTSLHLAARICNVAMVKLLLHHGADVNARNYLGDTPLHFALLCTEGDCAFGNFYKVVQTLLDAGADLGVANNRGCTPLQDALTQRKTFLWEDILKLVRLLLEQHRIDLNFKDRDDNTPLHLAAATCNVEMVKLLLNYQTDIDSRNKAGDTPLMEAIRCYDTDAAAGVGMVEFVQLLVDRGANVTAANSMGCTPLHCAFLVPPDRRQPEDFKRLVKLLVALQARVNAQDAHGSSPLHLAAQTRQYDIEIAQLLLDNMANVDPKTALGDTPLLLAIQCYNDSDDNGFIDFVRLLLDRGANASATNLRDCSPLQYVFQMRKEIKKDVFSCLIRLLVEHQADVNVKIGVIGNSLLHLAVKSSSCDLELILLLLEYGADVNARNELGETPLHRALKSHSSRHVSDDDLLNRCELLLIAGAKACSQNHEGRTPLHEAVDNDKVTSVQLLLDYSAEVDVKDRSGDTPLLLAVRRSNVESVTLLLEHGGDQNAANNSDETPLLLACAKKSLDMVYQLIRLSPHHLRPQLRRLSEESFGY